MGSAMKVTDTAEVRRMLKLWVLATSTSTNSNSAESTTSGEEKEQDKGQGDQDQDQKGPSKFDIQVLEEYLYKVVSIERDMDKVRGLVKWLEWCVLEGERGEGGSGGGSGDGSAPDGESKDSNDGKAGGEEHSGADYSREGAEERISEKRKGKMPAKTTSMYAWPEAVEIIKASVQEAMRERGLGEMKFE